MTRVTFDYYFIRNMNKTTVLLVILSLVLDRLIRYGSKLMCESGVNQITLERIEAGDCSNVQCLKNGNKTEYWAASCGETEKSFHESLVKYGSGRNFSISWFYLTSDCSFPYAIQADAVDSCEGAEQLTCQDGRAKQCVYVQPNIPVNAPVAVDVPTAQQQSPNAATSPLPDEELSLTTLEKVGIGAFIGGWGLAILFVVLYIYNRKKSQQHAYSLVSTHEEEPKSSDQPNINTLPRSALADESKYKTLKIAASEVTVDWAKKLGSGQACDVYAGKWRQKDVAIKVPRSQVASDKLMTEMSVFNNIQLHPNIVEVYGYFINEEKRICVVLEYCNMQTLEHLQKKLTIADKLNFAQGIADGIQHLHHAERPVVHRDLKPGNILVTKLGLSPIPKISDFDYSRRLATPAGVTKSNATAIYSAPEQLAAPEGQKPYSVKSDVWAYGAILFFMLTGRHPYSNEDDKALTSQRLNKQVAIRYDLLDNLPKDPSTKLMIDVMRKCLQDNPDQRPTFDQIVDDFKDFFDKLNPIDQANNNNIQ